MKNLKAALFCALCIMMLSGCGAQENYDNTAATHRPESTQNNNNNNNNNNSVGDDVGNMIDDTGDAVDNAGKAVGDTVKDVGDAVKD